MKRTHKVPFRYIGSKSYLAPFIIENFPEHTCYVEVFGGTGAVLFRKPLSIYEVYNDLESEIYIFFKILRNQSDELIKLLTYTPPSRKLYNEYCQVDPISLTEVERAARFFFLQMFAFSGNPTGGGNFPVKSGFPVRSGYRKDGSYRQIGAGMNYKIKVDYLNTFADRLRSVVLENLNFKELIERYDYDQCFFYCDPPYLHHNYYIPQFDLASHKTLSKLLHKIKGKVMLSYYPHETLEDLYPSNTWYYKSYIVEQQAAKGYTNEHKVTELLIMNYDPTKDKWRGRGQTAIDQFFN